MFATFRPNEKELSRAADTELGYLWECCSHQKEGIAPGSVGFSDWLGLVVAQTLLVLPSRFLVLHTSAPSLPKRRCPEPSVSVRVEGLDLLHFRHRFGRKPERPEKSMFL